MKRRYQILLLTVFLALAIAVALLSRPTAKDFFLGTRECELSRIEFEGQGRHATLSDPAALAYLVSLPKLEALPPGVENTRQSSFGATFYDKWGYAGWMAMHVSTNEWGLVYLGSPFGVESFRFILIQSNPPPQLEQMMVFLLDESNRGKSWTSGDSPPAH
jgi:hypothetical protein